MIINRTMLRTMEISELGASFSSTQGAIVVIGSCAFVVIHGKVMRLVGLDLRGKVMFVAM